MAGQDYAAVILDAVNTLVDGKLKNLTYDTTVEATITSVKRKAEGIYTVSATGVNFEAYSNDGSTYYTNDSVYVTIPNGDYNNQKFIVGRKTDESVANKTFKFKLPFDDFIGLQFLNKDIGFTGEYRANDITSQDQLIWAYYNENNSTIGCSKLGIEANFQTLLGNYHPLRGKYGFKILISGLSKTTDVTASQKISTIGYFTNDDMYGNTYAFYSPYVQQKIFDVSAFQNIYGVAIYFYQDCLFADSTNKLIPYVDDSGNLFPANIIVSDLHVYLGLGSEDINTEKVFLYTYDSLSYSEQQSSRELHFAWVHKEKDGSFTLVNNADTLAAQIESTGFEATEILWYHYKYGTEIISNDFAHQVGGVNWEYLEDNHNLFAITVSPDLDRSREKYKVIIHHDNIYNVSDVLTLTNEIDVDALREGLSANEEIIFKCLRAATDGDGNGILVEDNAIGNFLVYDENNRVIRNDNQILYSDIYYYLQINIRNNESGAYAPLIIDDTAGNSGYSIAWKFPQSYTMLQNYERITTSDPGFTNYDPNSPEFKALQKITLKFKIGSYLNLRYKDNTVGAVVTRNEESYYIHKTFQFDRASSMGTEYTAVVEIRTPTDGTHINIGERFAIACVLYNKDGSVPENTSLYNFTWKLYGGANICEDINGNTPGFAQTQVDGEEYVGNVITGYLLNNIPPLLEVTITNAADYPIVIRKGIMIGNNIQYMQTHDIICADRVEFKSDGANPYYYNSVFEVREIITDDELLSYPEWHISKEDIVYLNPTTFQASTFSGSDGSSFLRDSYVQYALRFSIQRNLLEHGTPQWTDDLASDENFTYIYYQDGTTYVAQALAFDRNIYPSSLVNEWNGTDLTLDTENSAVLAKMIAAGTKDFKGRFTGVMMGDWSAKADESFDSMGLYGLQNGAMSFGLLTDGTGFIGPSGKGRIEFDGQQALLSNTDKSCYINLNPVTIGLNTNLLSLANKSFSQYFLYCRTPKVESIIDSTFSEDTPYWTKKFFDDDQYDYFIVDPNNGILTTGGIIAKYGSIGNWHISKQGLYQKDSTNNKYMFLGYNPNKANPLNGSEDVDYGIFMSSNEYADPLFSVTWDGYMTARKGKIGKISPWHISDSGLTQTNNFGTIYMGSPVGGSDWDNGDKFIIWAGTYTGLLEGIAYENAYQSANFAVSNNGHLYSIKGTIGGWNITENDLTSSNGVIRLNSSLGQIIIGEDDDGNAAILIDGNTGIITLQHLVGDVNTGQIWLAGYALESQTSGAITYPYDIAVVPGTTNQTPTLNLSTSIDNTNSWSGGSSFSVGGTVAPPASYLSEVTNTNITLASSNVFNIVKQETNGNYGISVATGISTPATGSKKTVVICPVGASLNYASLGTQSAPWNIYANVLSCAKLNSAGVIAAQTMYMNQEKVATEPYVYNLLVAIWNAINSVSSGGSSNGASIHGLGRNLRDLAVTQVTPNYENISNGQIKFDFKNADGAILYGTYAASVTHHHQVTCEETSGTIKITIGGLVGAAGEDSDSFNIADTTYFRTWAYSSLSVSGTSYTDGKSMSATISVKNKLGDVIATPTVDIYAAGPWWDGYYEGYDAGVTAGKNSVSHSCSGLNTIPGTSIKYVTGCFGTKYL